MTNTHNLSYPAELSQQPLAAACIYRSTNFHLSHLNTLYNRRLVYHKSSWKALTSRLAQFNIVIYIRKIYTIDNH